ncbi:MAG: phosphopantetheine-binding protein [bacterium]|nr:phosphopantetheine-binding protein [bacterium]
MNAFTELELELKRLIIQTLDLEDLSPEDIDSQESLFGEGLGLDSIDALELGIALQKSYGLKLSGDSEENRRHFFSISSLAQLVAAHQTS